MIVIALPLERKLLSLKNVQLKPALSPGPDVHGLTRGVSSYRFRCEEPSPKGSWVFTCCDRGERLVTGPNSTSLLFLDFCKTLDVPSVSPKSPTAGRT